MASIWSEEFRFQINDSNSLISGKISAVDNASRAMEEIGRFQFALQTQTAQLRNVEVFSDDQLIG